MEQKERPFVIVIGGPNGAGKTTSAFTLLPSKLDIKLFVNADIIATGLSAFAPEQAAFQAGRIMLNRLDELAASSSDFAFETTLASRTFAPFLRRIKKDGYRTTVLYVWLQSPDLAIRRVAERVRRGGHFVPDIDVRRRYLRGLQNFFNLYQPLADEWFLCDNSGSNLTLVAEGGLDRAEIIHEQELYDVIKRCAQAEE